MNSVFLSGARWIMDSGIQDGRGGFRSWYDVERDAYGYLYSEITGYGITALAFMHRMLKDRRAVDRAQSACDWLCREAMTADGGFRTRKYAQGEGDPHYSFEGGYVYSFDCGMVLAGMVNLWELTHDDLLLSKARSSGEFLLSKMLRPDGGFYAYCDASGKMPVDEAGRWSTQSGSYHAKLAVGLIKLARATGEEKYARAARSACDNAVKRFDGDRFVTDRSDGSTHLHPHCYSIEGLLYAGKIFGDAGYIRCAKDATSWALSQQLSTGGLPFKYTKDNGPIGVERVDILGQILRMGAYFMRSGGRGQISRNRLQGLASRLETFQIAAGPVKAKGGFSFGYDHDGVKKDHANAWCTMFALQAAAWYYGGIDIPETEMLESII